MSPWLGHASSNGTPVGMCQLPQVPRTRGDIDRTRGDDEWTELHEETMAKIRAVMMFTTVQVAKPTLTADQQNISSLIELSDATGT